MLIAKVIGGLLLAVSAALFYFTGTAFRRVRGFLGSAVTADGVIVRLVERVERGNDDSVGDTKTYYPAFAFRDAQGQEHEVVSSVSAYPRVGKSVKVLYDPQNPGGARLHGFLALWFWPLLLLAMGGGFCAVGLVFLFAVR